MDNKAADGLSRKPEGVELASLVVPTLVDMAATRAEVYEESKLKETIEKLKVDGDNVSNFSLQQGVLKYQGRLVILKTSSLSHLSCFCIQGTFGLEENCFLSLSLSHTHKFHQFPW